jgi:hypothetical protein
VEGVRAPNLGPIWAQRPRLGITERLLDREGLLHPLSLETHRQIPTNLGVKSHEFCFVRRHRDDLAITDDLVLPMKAWGVTLSSFLPSASLPSQRTPYTVPDVLESRRDEDPPGGVDVFSVSRSRGV